MFVSIGLPWVVILSISYQQCWLLSVVDHAFSGLLREVYYDVTPTTRGEIRALYETSKYPNNPDLIDIIQDFDTPVNFADDYGQRIRGYFKAPETGLYQFFSSCDEMCDLFLSVDEEPRHKGRLISQVQASKRGSFNEYVISVGTEAFSFLTLYPLHNSIAPLCSKWGHFLSSLQPYQTLTLLQDGAMLLRGECPLCIIQRLHFGTKILHCLT